MPQFCAVINCGSKSGTTEKLSFFRIPSEKDTSGKVTTLCKQRREQWIRQLKRADLTESILKNDRICSKHFISGKPSTLYDTENPDWKPTLNMGYDTNKMSNPVKDLKRYERSKKRKQEHECTAQPLPRSENVSPVFQSGENNIDKAEQLDDREQLNFALPQANLRIYSLEGSLKRQSFDRDGFEGNDLKTNFYTGIKSFNLLDTVFKYIKVHLSTKNSSLNAFQQLTLTLMKLRHNYSFTDIAYRYDVDRRTVSRIFYKCLNLLYYRLKRLIYWPTKEELMSTMPESFKSIFGNKVTTIIDCFEVFMEKSSNVDAASSMFSHYKHHQTVKFLIAISPQGTIMFISEGYGGKASDKMITDSSGLLEKLSPGDLILADRGFLIKEVVNNYLADVKTPAFKKGKTQMSPQDVEESRKLSSVRVHVERVIGCLKQKYTIFHNTMSMDVVKNMYTDNILVVDKIVTVCCALYNINPSIVPNC